MSVVHKKSSPLCDKVVTLSGNNECVLVIDWWDHFAKRRWAWCYSLGTIQYYAFRVIMEGLPCDDEVLLVEDAQGHRALVHFCELISVNQSKEQS